MAPAVIEARGLGRIFGTTAVLRGVDLRLEAGRGAIVIGGNGAGKSTLLKLLAGLAAPSFGNALLFGVESRALDAVARRRLGMLTHQSFLYPNLSARENLEFYGALYGLREPQRAAARWLERVGLSVAADERVRAFSRGMEQRLAIARAMLAEPDALLMDEPFAGLDRNGASLVSALVKEAIARRCAVLITAHGTPGLEGLEFERWELSRGRLAPSREESRPGRIRSLFGG